MAIQSKRFLLPFLLFILFSSASVAQDTAKVSINRPNLFIDCYWCPDRYLKENIDIVNFVRSPSVAQIQLILTRARTGAGTEVTMRFVGLDKFKDIKNTVLYFTPSTATEQEERKDFVRHVRQGLLPFIAESNLTELIEVTYTDIEGAEGTMRVNDPWNHWVFDISASGGIEGQETRRSLELGARISAERITREWKIDLDLVGNYEKAYVELEVEGNDGDTTTTTIKTFSFLESSKRFRALAVKSLSPHWSVGAIAGISSSTFNNKELEVGAGPAIEFNIFPYREYNRHRLSFLYKLLPVYVQYNDTTIYNKIDQFLVKQSIGATYELVETWGEIFVAASASAYLHDFSKNRIDVRTRLEFRIYRGLSVFISGEYSLINNQLALPKGDITNRQALLRLRDRATGYAYEFSVGLSFTFGSIYSNIVNPRF